MSVTAELTVPHRFAHRRGGLPPVGERDFESIIRWNGPPAQAISRGRTIPPALLLHGDCIHGGSPPLPRILKVPCGNGTRR